MRWVVGIVMVMLAGAAHAQSSYDNAGGFLYDGNNGYVPEGTYRRMPEPDRFNRRYTTPRAGETNQYGQPAWMDMDRRPAGLGVDRFPEPPVPETMIPQSRTGSWRVDQDQPNRRQNSASCDTYMIRSSDEVQRQYKRIEKQSQDRGGQIPTWVARDSYHALLELQNQSERRFREIMFNSPNADACRAEYESTSSRARNMANQVLR